MTNMEYAQAVDSGLFPEDPTVPPGTDFVDDRGKIHNVLLTPITSVARITSKRGSMRANHTHKTDWHYALVEHGEVYYFERVVGDEEIPVPKIYGKGEMFFTQPNREHCMLFSEDSVIYTFAKNIRTHENHEADLVRVDFLTQEIAAGFLA